MSRTKKVLSLVFSLVFVIGLMPSFTAFADESNAGATSSETENTVTVSDDEMAASDEGADAQQDSESSSEASQTDLIVSEATSDESAASGSDEADSDSDDEEADDEDDEDAEENETVELTVTKLDSSEAADEVLKSYNEVRGVEINDEGNQVDRQIEGENTDIKPEITNDENHAITVNVCQACQADLVFVETEAGFYTMAVPDGTLSEKTDYTAKFDDAVKRVSVFKMKSEEELAAQAEEEAQAEAEASSTVELEASKLDSSTDMQSWLNDYTQLRVKTVNEAGETIDGELENANEALDCTISNGDGTYEVKASASEESSVDVVLVQTETSYYTLAIPDANMLPDTLYHAAFDEAVVQVSFLQKNTQEKASASAASQEENDSVEELVLTKLNSKDDVTSLKESYTSVRAKTINSKGALTDAKVDALNDKIDISITNDETSGEVSIGAQEKASATIVLIQTQDAYYTAAIPNDTLSQDLTYHAAVDGKVKQVTVYKQKEKQSTTQATVTPKASVSYCAHVQNVGWQSWVKNGKTAGTSGKALRVEGLKIKVDANVKGSIQYSAHVQNVGWQDWVSDGKMAGTSGKSLRVEAIKIKLTGELSKDFDVYYRCHVQNYGWLDWAKNGEAAGSQGMSYRVEAVQIKLVKKGGAAPGSTTTPFQQKLVEYSAHVENVGWQDYVADGETAGTSGQSLRVEALKINLGSGVSGGISYSAHVQNVGWQDWVSNGKMAGTSGQSLRVEALKIKLTGAAANKYDVYYRVHVQNLGWLDWASNGAEAGSSGLAYRIEAIQIKLVPKGSAAPGSTSKPYVTPSVSYKVYKQGKGWTSTVKNGKQAGTTGQSLPLEGIQVSVADLGVTGGVTYSTHIENTGWVTWSSNGKTSGKVGKNLQMEAVKIKLTGAAANQFDIYYRCHVANYGWLGWAKNGAAAGSEGQSLAVEAIQIKLVLKGNSAPGSTTQPFISESTSTDSLNITLDQMTSYQSTSLSYSELKSVLNPNSYSSSSAKYYQFADLRGYSGLTAGQLDAYIASTSSGRSGNLKNMGMAFVSAAKTYDINECYLLSHAILESGWGTSELASGYYYNGSTYYNFYGIGAYDDSPLSGGRAMAVNNGWTSPAKAISGAASWINSNYTRSSSYAQPTLYAMKWDYARSSDTYARGWHQYATDPYWPTSIATIMSNCYSYNDYKPALDYIVPKYK